MPTSIGRTAVLVIDMQNSFCHPDGALYEPLGAPLAGIEDLERDPDDVVIDKNRMDSFYGTDLDEVLQSQGIASLVLVGVVTNACVESAARSAAMRDYPVELLADCCAGVTRQHHDMSLECLHAYQFATVTTLAEALAGSLA